MTRDSRRDFLEGTRSAPQSPPRHTEPTAAPPPPPRTVRANDRAEFVVYAGAWHEWFSCPEEEEGDEEPDLEAAADGDDEDDGPDDGAVYLPLNGGC
ncbi:hypothetical protein ACFQL8_30685 [Streptomyces goshikiensis]|uniref:hypothetical protein n=1 Tax=Streptomyces goshikiensis TaxID=1942 RepID=UPI001676C6B9|nr:hypothetical protein [Streptomyces goshikiensis]GHD83256.1 hypothetical protein GCM10010336_74360 [Streptomyces goshikiensis]